MIFVWQLPYDMSAELRWLAITGLAGLGLLLSIVLLYRCLLLLFAPKKEDE